MQLVINKMLHAWTVKTQAQLLSPKAIGVALFGAALVQGKWIDEKTGDSLNAAAQFKGVKPKAERVPESKFETPPGAKVVPTVKLGAESATVKKVPQFMNRGRVVKLEVALWILRQASAKAVLNLQQQNARRVAAGRLAWRRWATLAASVNNMKVELPKAEARMKAAVLKWRKRTGIQRVSTTRKGLKKWGVIKWGGRPGWRAPRGRPVLPADEWRKRYLARLVKRRKTSKRFKATHNPTIPGTRTPRPPVILDLHSKDVREAKRFFTGWNK